MNNSYLTNDLVKYFEKIILNNLNFLFLFKNKLLNKENIYPKIKFKFPLTSILAGKNNLIIYELFTYFYRNFNHLF